MFKEVRITHIVNGERVFGPKSFLSAFITCGLPLSRYIETI